jgi:hypothetical protein
MFGKCAGGVANIKQTTIIILILERAKNHVDNFIINTRLCIFHIHFFIFILQTG